MKLQEYIDQLLVASADAHFIAGQLMVEKVDPDAINEAAKQLERTARKLRQLAKSKSK